MTYKLLKLSKVVDKQIWDFEHPLRQCEGMTFEVLQKLEAKKLTMDRLRDMDSKEIGAFEFRPPFIFLLPCHWCMGGASCSIQHRAP